MGSVKASVEHGVVDRAAVIDNPSMRYASSLNHSPSHLVGCNDRTVDERVAFVKAISGPAPITTSAAHMIPFTHLIAVVNTIQQGVNLAAR